MLTRLIEQQHHASHWLIELEALVAAKIVAPITTLLNHERMREVIFLQNTKK
jgi:hypothetical protein